MTATTSAKKTVGTATLSSSGGSIIGVAVATILFSLLPLDQSPEMFGAIAIVCSAVFAVLCGYLSPSKAEALKPYLEQSSEDVTKRSASIAPEAKPSSGDRAADSSGKSDDAGEKRESESYAAQHVAPEEPPAAKEPGLRDDVNEDAYPDLDSMAKMETV